MTLDEVELRLDEVQQTQTKGDDLQPPVERLLAEITHLEQSLAKDQARLGEAAPARPAWELPTADLRAAANRLATDNLTDTAAEEAIDDCWSALHEAQAAILGNPLLAWVRQQTSPGQSSLQGVAARLAGVAGPVALGAGGFVAEFVIGLVVMIISLYYFLADGPEMAKAVMRMSPLDDRYEEQLLQEFGNISRAVVLATLLSALAQGALAGMGYFVAGLESVFFLTVLTTVLAMIPFVGAGAVWLPCSLWLALVENRMWAGILLALYGALVVSMVDNLIKPTVLHGRSNLHPLLALLSVLGGVKALGPIGIFVGPMVLAFLQTLLNMLSHEVSAWEKERGIPLKASFASRPAWRTSQTDSRAPEGRLSRTSALRPRKR
jgi:predicted PurR-regulated permease PerM